MIEDIYIRAAVRESTRIPEERKQRIIERFITKQMTFDGYRYSCPRCKKQTPKTSHYCYNCGQMVTIEKPVKAILN